MPDQYFTPATGQRAYTLVDVVSSINDQLNGGADDNTTTPDAAQLINIFANFTTDNPTAVDTVTATAASPLGWDMSQPYSQGMWS